jgi:hypothetical protein
VTVDPATLAGLRPAERARLDRFATVFERLDASRYATLTEGFDTAEVEAAKATALERIGRSGRRRDAARAAVRAFTDAATVAYADRMSLPDTLLLFQSLPDRAPDRLRFLQSVERVIVALILWDELDEDDRDVLVGPWAALVEPLVADDS